MNKISAIHYFFLAILVNIITLQPYFMHGAINFYETGIYLPQINEAFHGKILYKDMFILRGPFEILMPGFLMAVFGKHIGVLNWYFYAGTVLTLIICAIFSLNMFRTRFFAYLFTLVLIARTFHWATFHIWGGIRFGWGILALLIFAIFLKCRPLWLLFLTGAVTAIAFWTSFEIGASSCTAILITLCLTGYIERDAGSTVKSIGIYMAGALIASLPCLVYLSINSALVDYASTVKTVLTDMTDVFNHSLTFDTPKNFSDFLLSLSPGRHNFKYTLPFLFYILVAAYMMAKFVKRAMRPCDFAIIAVGIYGVFLYRGAFRDIEGPQYRMALQPVLLIMFFYLEDIWMRLRGARQSIGIKKMIIMAVIIAIPVSAVIFSAHKYSRRFFIFKEINSMLVEKMHAPIPYSYPEPTAIQSERAKGIIAPASQAREVDSVVAYITSHVKEGEAVFAFPDLGAYNFLTDRPPVSRFYTAEFSFMKPSYFKELMLDLKNKKPRYVICARDFSRLEKFRATLGAHLDEARRFLRENYDVVEEYATVDILKIKDRPYSL
jgi:hypothetical protein